ncbi:MAG: endonuclease/exonuclease/phosphatase family protein [Nesterenkonia sp.]
MNTDDSALFGAAAAPALQVMSWNVRRRRTLPSARGADRWNTRAPRLRSLLSAERPTLLGAQEARTDQAEFLRSSLGMRYGIVGRGRGTGGRGEGCPILYDAERLELLDWNQTALSDRPDRPGSVSWGNIIPRILVTASFHDRATGQTFLALNTHFDHLSERSRRRSAQAVRGAAAESGLPAVVTGDLNAGPRSAPLRELLDRDTLTDSWAEAQKHDSQEWDTFANYRAPCQHRGRVDWILVSPAIRVLRAAINAHQYDDGWASDHLPVQALISLSADALPRDE